MLDFDKAKLEFKNADVAGFGKIIFVSKNHTIPALPDMNLIVFKKGSIFQAVCINIEVDAVGDNLKDACKNLKATLRAYIAQMVENHDNNLQAAAADIVNTAYAEGELKQLFFMRYLETKHQYVLDKIAKKNKAKSRLEEVSNALKRIFQFESIWLDTTPLAAVV